MKIVKECLSLKHVATYIVLLYNHARIDIHVQGLRWQSEGFNKYWIVVRNLGVFINEL